ncbi:HVO_A0556 family zinc finger protein [Halobaculum limi]|uniref:HVO_A0556 family zinc finger protein n=1 Tax=Halobaculum limi TaxID=3031916 RepID=UPI00240529B3|nr:HVO_A0556 family zinc finger protein [Halobaculum sp. YSMS11]
MSQRPEGRPTGRDVLARLDGDDCTLPACDGTLDRQPFKQTDAVVCDECGTPQVRVWDDD